MDPVKALAPATPNVPGSQMSGLIMTKLYLVSGFNPSEKYESQLGLLFPIYGK
jgi:hypothetical protein